MHLIFHCVEHGGAPLEVVQMVVQCGYSFIFIVLKEHLSHFDNISFYVPRRKKVTCLTDDDSLKRMKERLERILDL